jgi:hypothetical protein
VVGGRIDLGAVEYQPPATTVALTATAALAAQPVTLTATVAGQAPGSSTPSGTVTFLDGTSSLGTVALSGGVAQLTVTLPAGTHALSAQYSGATAAGLTFNPSTASKTLDVPAPVVAPRLTGVRPSTVVEKTAVTLLVTGAHFTRHCVVELNGHVLTTTFLSSTALRVKVPLLLPTPPVRKGHHPPARHYALLAGKPALLAVVAPGAGTSTSFHLKVRAASHPA